MFYICGFLVGPIPELGGNIYKHVDLVCSGIFCYIVAARTDSPDGVSWIYNALVQGGSGWNLKRGCTGLRGKLPPLIIIVLLLWKVGSHIWVSPVQKNFIFVSCIYLNTAV